ncbi:MAG: flavodoxin [Devosia sp.]|nr:flavodoxin [Devosia sp.]
MARVLVVYFSLTGHTKQIAEAIAGALHADLDPIADAANRTFSPSHMIWFAMEAILQQMPQIHEPRHDPSEYDVVVIGTPVWAGRVAPPVHTYIDRYKAQFKHLALFCTEGGANGEHALKQMAELAGFEPKAQLIVTEGELAAATFAPKVEAFVKTVAAVPSDLG